MYKGGKRGIRRERERGRVREGGKEGGSLTSANRLLPSIILLELSVVCSCCGRENCVRLSAR